MLSVYIDTYMRSALAAQICSVFRANMYNLDIAEHAHYQNGGGYGTNFHVFTLSVFWCTSSYLIFLPRAEMRSLSLNWLVDLLLLPLLLLLCVRHFFSISFHSFTSIRDSRTRKSCLTEISLRQKYTDVFSYHTHPMREQIRCKNKAQIISRNFHFLWRCCHKKLDFFSLYFQLKFMFTILFSHQSWCSLM